jgi:hypothetical protein
MAPKVRTTSAATHRRAALMVLVAIVSLTLQVAMAIDVKVDAQKTFDFKTARTWAWHTDGKGDVKMARTAADDAAAMKQEAEPVIASAVMTEMDRRGVQFRAEAPDVYVTYYLLLTTAFNAQHIGQFLPAVADWGLPPFAAATQSLEMMNSGSLVLDISSAQRVVWRGVASSKIKIGEEPARRDALLRQAVRDLLKKFPPKS